MKYFSEFLQVKVNEGSQSLVQFKLRPDVITPENVHTNIFLSSMVDSPVDSLYYMIKSVFTPALRDSKSNNASIQSSLNELEQILQSTGKKTSAIFHPRDEINYWIDITRNTSSKNKDIERAKYFLEFFDPMRKDFDKLER